ncbi:MAG: chemotaxis protein CheA [Bacteroidales bacterium]|nr:chemotaxis protein CheA [Bacteroidales bacterium]
MSDKSSEKYVIEVKALLVNLKIAIQEFDKDSASDTQQEVLAELYNQLNEVSSIYGINSVIQYTNRLLDILKHLHHSDKAAEKVVREQIGNSEAMLQKLAEDPVMKDKQLKAEYSSRIRTMDELTSKLENEEQEAGNTTRRFKDVFIEEAFDLVNQLEEKMLQLESDPEDESMIDQVFRIMHTLKGNSNMFGYNHLGAITHELENIYDEIRSHKINMTRGMLEVTLECIDHFRNLIEDSELSDDNNKIQHEQILLEIKGFSASAESLTGQDEELLTEQKVQKGNDFHTFYIFFKPERDIFNDGTNPLYFVYDLNELGECLPVPVLHPDSVGAAYIPENCYTAWHIVLTTDHNEDEVREHFMFLKEESQPAFRILSEENLLHVKGFPEYFRKQVEGKNNLIELDVTPYTAQSKSGERKKVTVTGQSNHEAISSVRVSSQKIDQMMNLISELVIKQAELSLLAVSCDNQKLMEVAESIENISRDLRDNAFSISLIPLEKSVLRFQRLVRDVSKRFDKKVDFVVEGKETELDKTIIEKIVDPIMHILRNNIDHGIELPSERKKKGKPETGTITLRAYPSGAHVVIEISDDGAGINLEKVRETAVKKGMLSASENITNDELMHLIVSPGFSTAENISEVSGRGVGMDVVNQKISEIRGELEMKTEKDIGTTMTIKLPLTISIIDSLLLKCAGDFYLVPLAVVERCAEVKAKQILKAENKYVILADEYIPFIDLRTEFLIDKERPDVQQILLVKFRDIVVGLIVDEVIGNYQAVLKSLGAAYRKQEIISGASILGSGEIALVLDVSRIIQEYSAQNELKINAMA